MKQKDVLQSAAEILGLQETGYPLLLRCANLVLANIAANYRDCVTKQVFNITNGKIEYKNFEKTFLRVKNVSGGVYSLYVDYLQVPNGKVEVEYCFVPKFTDDAEQEIFIPNLSEQIFVYGVITEYALISGMFNEAKAWSEKFEAGLFKSDERNKNLCLKI
jgi:hypothetical protein